LFSGHDEIINDEEKVIPEQNKCNIQNDVKTLNLKEYIEKLKRERKNWQEEYRKRKIKLRILTKEKANMEQKGQNLDISVLSESERTFLLKRPNYEYICKNIQKLLDMALKINILNQFIRKLNRRFMETMESNISKATRKIIKMSEQ